MGLEFVPGMPEQTTAPLRSDYKSALVVNRLGLMAD